MSDFLSSHLIGNKIEGFPYKEQFCKFCEQQMNLVKVIHLSEEEMHYKAIYGCFNKKCLSYDEAGKSYAKIYYSSWDAVAQLEGIVLPFPRLDKDSGPFKEDWY